MYFAPVQPITGLLSVTKLIDNFDAEYEYVANDGTVFTLKTNLEAPKYKLIRGDIAPAAVRHAARRAPSGAFFSHAPWCIELCPASA